MRPIAPLVLAAIAGAASTLAALPTAGASGDGGATAYAVPTVTITTTSLPGAGGPHRVGGNQRWVRDADGAIVDPGAGHAQDPYVIRTSAVTVTKRIGLTGLRYAGGTVANLFDWTHSKPGGTVGCQTGGGFVGKPFSAIAADDSRYTIDAAADFAHRVGAQVNVMVPMINQTPQDAVGYVRAVKQATGASNVIVEIGNEPYLANQRYWRSADFDTRLGQYINGGKQTQKAGTGDYAGNLGLFRPGSCDRRTPVNASGAKNQRYVTRFGPIATSPAPVVHVAGNTWRYVSGLGAAHQGQRVFTLSKDHTQVVFGDGSNGRIPQGTMSIDYTVAAQAGFNRYYQALKSAFGKGVSVCSGWGRTELDGNAFVARMNAANKPYDCVAMHQYAPMPAAGATGATLVDQTFASADNWADRLDKLSTQIHGGSNAQRAARFVIVTEFGTLTPNGHGGQFVSTLRDARLLVSQLRHKVELSEFPTLSGLYTRTNGAVSGRSAAGYLATMASTLTGTRPVTLSGVPGGAPIKPVATRSGERADLLLVNTSATAGWSAALRVPGIGASCLSTYRLDAAPSANLGSTRVQNTPSVRKVASGAAAGESFPAHSVTLLTWRPPTSDGTCATPTW